MTFRAEETESFEKLFDKNKEQIRAQKGCRHLELLQDTQDPRRYSTYSIWHSAEDLEAYRHSELFASVWPATKALFEEKPVAMSLNKKIMLP